MRKKWLVIGIGALLLVGIIGILVFWHARHVSNAVAAAEWDRTFLAASKGEPGAMDLLRAQSNTKERNDVAFALGLSLFWEDILPDYQRKGLPYTAKQVVEWGAKAAEAREKLDLALKAERNSR
jgi:hypothetical protein